MSDQEHTLPGAAGDDYQGADEKGHNGGNLVWGVVERSPEVTE